MYNKTYFLNKGKLHQLEICRFLFIKCQCPGCKMASSYGNSAGRWRDPTTSSMLLQGSALETTVIYKIICYDNYVSPRRGIRFVLHGVSDRALSLSHCFFLCFPNFFLE